MKQIYDNYYITENGDIFNKYNKKIKPCDNGRGYLMVGLTDASGKRIIKTIHRNNCLSNLEWLSHGDNIKHSYNLNNRSSIGFNNANCKTTEEVVLKICTYLSEGFKSSDIRDFGFSYDLVRSIKRRKCWKHISKDFIF